MIRIAPTRHQVEVEPLIQQPFRLTPSQAEVEPVNVSEVYVLLSTLTPSYWRSLVQQILVPCAKRVC